MSLPHFILGLLHYNPLSGYDLNKLSQATIQSFWTTDQSQIYRALHKMEAEGWVASEVIVQADSPNKKLYHVTEAGRAQLHHWLGELHDESPQRHIWIGQIFFSDALSTEEFTHLLNTRIKDMQERLTMLESVREHYYANADWAHLPPMSRSRLLALEYGIQIVGAEIEWAQAAIQRIRQ